LILARARTLKPGFFTSEQLLDCSAFARLLFAGLWLIADREGRLEDRPRKIKLEIFPGDDVDCDALLGELEQAGLLARYEVEEVKYIQVLKFRKHQNPHPKEAASSIPEMPSHVITRQAEERCDQVTEIQNEPGLLPSPLSPLPIPDSNAAADRERIRFARNAVLDEFGHKDDPNWFGDTGIVASWINSGADLELDILPTIRRIMKRRGSQAPPRSLAFFNQAIADAMATRTKPLPPGTARPKATRNGYTTGTDHARAAAELLAERPPDPGTTGPAHVALLAPERRPGDVEGEISRLAG